MSGYFITFEGVEGCGKSTQSALLCERLRSAGYGVVETREPGGTPIAEMIRGIVLDPATTNLDPMAELLLFQAARAQHVAERIRPALEFGNVVVCDRYTDSTTAYQGGGRGMDIDVIERLHGSATGDLKPDLTVWVDVPVVVGRQRAAERSAADRMEQEELAFHERVADAFAMLAARDSERYFQVDGEQAIDELSDLIWSHVEANLRVAEVPNES